MIRKYERRQVPEQLISKLIDSAARAPSAGHTQVQEFIVVKDPDTKRKLRKAGFGEPRAR